MKKPFKESFVGKLLQGAKGIGLDVLGSVMPNTAANIARPIGGEGKVHIPGAVVSWATSIIMVLSAIWAIYRFITGEDPSIIQEELKIINPSTQG